MAPVKRAVLALLAIVVCAAALYGLTATRRDRNYRRLIARGDAALASDDTFAAIENFSGAIVLKGTSMVGYLKRGEAYLRRQNLDSAGRGTVGQLDPPAEAALRDLTRASDLDPLAPRPFELLGDVNYSLSRFDRAAERYQASVSLDDRSPRVLYKLALAHYRAGRQALAVSALQQAVAINDRFAEAFYLLGLCHRDLQQPAESLRALETSVRIAPAMLYAREELADLYGRLGRVDDRLAQLEALWRLDPGPSRQVTLGLAYARAGQFDRGITTLGRAAERYPDHTYTYVALGRVWLEKAQARSDRIDLGKALGALQSVVGMDDSSEARTLFGRALLLAQDNDGAERMLQQASDRLPVDPLAFYYLAEAAERSRHPEVARRALLDYRALEGDDADPRRRAAFATRLADLSAAVGDAPAAVTWYERALEAGPQDASFFVRAADARMRSGDFEGARASLALALEKDPLNRAARVLQRRLRQ